MDAREEARSRFFQDASAAFLKLRGAPFILSSRELHVLSSWEREGIPLRIVLQGLEEAFYVLGRKVAVSPPRGRVTLSYCDPFVRRAHAQSRERTVGSRRTAPPGPTRKRAVSGRVEAFLRELPDDLAYLRGPFERALDLVADAADRTAELSRLEAEIAEALISNAPPGESERASGQVRRESPSLSPEERADAVRARLVKNLRERYGVPFVSYSYY